MLSIIIERRERVHSRVAAHFRRFVAAVLAVVEPVALPPLLDAPPVGAGEPAPQHEAAVLPADLGGLVAPVVAPVEAAVPVTHPRGLDAVLPDGKI